MSSPRRSTRATRRSWKATMDLSANYDRDVVQKVKLNGVKVLDSLPESEKTDALFAALSASHPEAMARVPPSQMSLVLCRISMYNNFRSLMYIPYQKALEYGLYEYYVSRLVRLLRYVPEALRSNRLKALALAQSTDPEIVRETGLSPDEHAAVQNLAIWPI